MLNFFLRMGDLHIISLTLIEQFVTLGCITLQVLPEIEDDDPLPVW